MTTVWGLWVFVESLHPTPATSPSTSSPSIFLFFLWISSSSLHSTSSLLSSSSPTGPKTLACSPTKRASPSGLWCWVTSRGRGQRQPTGWGLSVVMETVSPSWFSSCLVTHYSEVTEIFLLWRLLLLHDSHESSGQTNAGFVWKTRRSFNKSSVFITSWPSNCVISTQEMFLKQYSLYIFWPKLD